MTTINLGIAVQSNAGTAAVDLDKLVVSADKAEKGAAGVGRASREMSAALGSITSILTNIERHTGTMASGLHRASTEVIQLGASAGVASASLRAMETVAASVTMDMRGLSTGATVVTSSFQKEAVAVGSATAALRQNTQAANENRAAMASRAQNGGGGVQSFNTANVAAQFQDIAVTSAMGMSPLQIALQQGTQLSAVLGGQGLTGVVRTLGGAFAAILSPVSLITLGVVALSAVGLQALGGLFKGAKDVSEALEEQSEWLDKVLIGYDRARDAAESYVESATTRPEGAVASDLGTKREDALKTIDAVLAQIEARENTISADLANLRLGGDLFSDIINASTGLDDLGLTATSTNEEIGSVLTSLTKLAADKGVSAQVRGYATDFISFIEQMRVARAEAGSLGASLAALPRDIQIRLQVSQEFSSSMSDLGDLYVDPRSRFEVARENAKNLADQATATASSYGDLVGVGEEYERVLSSINKAESEASAKTGASGAKAAAKAAQKPFDQWESATAGFQKRIDQQQLEISLLGQSTYEVERQKAAFDLLNQAKDAGIPITATVTDQINSMSAEFASATVQLQQQQQAMAMIEGAATGVANAWKDGKLELSEILEIAMNLASQFMQMQKLGGSGGGGIGDLLGMIFGGGLPSPANFAAGGAGFLGGGASSWGPSFDGGGSTGSGSRSGGVDGRGGFRAILHPNETVIDHTRGQAANQNRPISVQTNIINNAGVEVIENSVDDGQGGVRQEITLNRAVAQQIAKPGAANSAVRGVGRLVRR